MIYNVQMDNWLTFEISQHINSRLPITSNYLLYNVDSAWNVGVFICMVGININMDIYILFLK